VGMEAVQSSGRPSRSKLGRARAAGLHWGGRDEGTLGAWGERCTRRLGRHFAGVRQASLAVLAASQHRPALCLPRPISAPPRRARARRCTPPMSSASRHITTYLRRAVKPRPNSLEDTHGCARPGRGEGAAAGLGWTLRSNAAELPPASPARQPWTVALQETATRSVLGRSAHASKARQSPPGAAQHRITRPHAPASVQEAACTTSNFGTLFSAGLEPQESVPGCRVLGRARARSGQAGRESLHRCGPQSMPHSAVRGLFGPHEYACP